MKKDEIAIDNAANKDWDISEVLKELNRKGYKMELRREATCFIDLNGSNGLCLQILLWMNLVISKKW